MKSLATFAPLALTLALCACTTPPATYKYSAKPGDPQVEFESDFDLHTKFSVNINDADANRCVDFESAGFLLKRDSVFIYDKPNKVLKVYVPADRRMTIAATYFFDDGNMRSSCGTLLRTFAPHMGGSYKVKMNYAAKACFLTVEEIDKSGAVSPVPSQSNPACSR